jgi:predicted nucleotidyltransferase
MGGYRTLDQRRRETLDAMRRGVEQLIPRLKSYASEHQGRYILFGSTVTDSLHDQSDVDLIADFPPDLVMAACAHAESLCDRFGLVADVRPRVWTSEPLLARALATGRVLG